MTNKQPEVVAVAEVMPLSHALAEIGKWGNLIRAFQRVQDVARLMESSEQAVRTLQEQAAQIKAENEALLAERAKALAEKEAAKHAAKRVKADAQDKADTLLTEARAEAAQIKAEAEAAAERVRTETAAIVKEKDELAAECAAQREAHADLLKQLEQAHGVIARAERIKAAAEADA